MVMHKGLDLDQTNISPSIHINYDSILNSATLPHYFTPHILLPEHDYIFSWDTERKWVFTLLLKYGRI